MHSSYFITEAVIKAASMGLKSVMNYFDLRLKSVEHAFTSKTEHGINSKSIENCPSMDDYGLLFTKIWVPESEIKEQLFDKKKALTPMNLQYLDLPYITRPTQAGFDFIYALAECETLDIFNLKSIQIVIDCHARYWDRINYLFVGLPMMVNLLLFWYWSNVVLPNLKFEVGFETHDTVYRIFLTTTAFYLILLEISAIVKKRL